MRFLRKRLRDSRLLAVMALATAACASAPRARSSSPQASALPAQADSASLEELERLEHERSRDPEIKMRLARRHACEGRTGIAIEHWLWVRQFAAKSSQAPEAESLYRQAASDPDALARRLSCPKP